MSLKVIDWTKPQRQSPAALLLLLHKALLSVVRFLWPLLLLWLLRKKSANSATDTYEYIILAVSVLSVTFSFLEYLHFRFSVSGHQLIIHKGVFTKQNITIPLEKIQAVHIEQGWLHSLLNVSRLSFDTAGSEKMEIKIEALDKQRSAGLKQFILDQRTIISPSAEPRVAKPDKVIITISATDLLKLSISANHLEALLLMLTFIFSTLDSAGVTDRAFSGTIQWVSENFAVEGIQLFILIGAMALLISIGISVIRVLLTYTNFMISEQENGYFIHSGLIQKKEKFLPFQKIQFISWKSNWIREKMKLYLLRFHATGTDLMENKMKVSVPVTRSSNMPVLVERYHSLLPTHQYKPLRIQRPFAWRRFIFVGLFPGLVVTIIFYFFMNDYFVFTLIWPVITAVHYLWYQRKFRFWANSEAIQIRKGSLGTQHILLLWRQIQYVELEQSLYQRRKKLATVSLHTAGGTVVVPYVTLHQAWQLNNFALFKIENSEWN